MTQIEIDKEISSVEDQISEVKREIEDEQDFYREAPNKSEFFDMMHGDEIQRLEHRLDALQLKRDRLEMMSPDESPTAVSQVASRAAGVLAVLAVSAVGALLACCFIFENSELAWR